MNLNNVYKKPRMNTIYWLILGVYILEPATLHVGFASRQLCFAPAPLPAFLL